MGYDIKILKQIRCRILLVVKKHKISFGKTNIFGYQFKGKGLKIVIENNAWTGYGSIVVSVVDIGCSAIATVGSVVLKAVEPYSIVTDNSERRILKALYGC